MPQYFSQVSAGSPGRLPMILKRAGADWRGQTSVSAGPGGSMSPIGGTPDFSFASALQYQGLSSETPQQLQTAGVISVPAAPDAATTDTSVTAATSGLSPTDTETAELVATMSAGPTGPIDPSFLAGAYQLVNTQTVQVIGGSIAGVGQQVDTTV
jgi:hypothetical protein